MATMKREAIREFFRRLHEANPNPQTELEYATPSAPDCPRFSCSPHRAVP